MEGKHMSLSRENAGSLKQWFKRLLGRRGNVCDKASLSPYAQEWLSRAESNRAGAATRAGSAAQTAADASAHIHNAERLQKKLPKPYFPSGAPGRVVVAPGIRDRFIDFRRAFRRQQARRTIEYAETSLAQYAEKTKNIQRKINHAQSQYQRYRANEHAIQLTQSMEQEFERLLNLTGITGLALQDSSLVLKAAIRHQHEGAWYDFGDWNLNLSWNGGDGHTNKWLTAETRQGFKSNWLEGHCYRYPVYRINPGVFCFGSMREQVAQHFLSGRIIEGAELALACMHFVNSEDTYKIPPAFNLAPDRLGAAAEATDTAKLTFAPNREAVMQAYAKLRAKDNSREKALEALEHTILLCESQLQKLREQRTQAEEYLVCAKRELDALEESSVADGERFDQQIDYLRNLAGVTHIDFCNNEMVLSVSVRFFKGSLLYDLGDWKVYLGHADFISRGFRIENERSGLCPPWNHSTPPGRQNGPIGSFEFKNELSNYISKMHYVEAAALAIGELYHFDPKELAAIPLMYMHIDLAAAAAQTRAAVAEVEAEVVAEAKTETGAAEREAETAATPALPAMAMATATNR
jgi:hypothetical protein